jgi:hypothetical protein
MVVVQTLLQDEAPVDQRVADMAKRTLGSPPKTHNGTVRSGESSQQTMRRENRPLAYHTVPSLPPTQRYGVEMRTQQETQQQDWLRDWRRLIMVLDAR